MQQDDLRLPVFARLNLRVNFAHNHLCRCGAPVVSRHRPHDRCKPTRTSSPKDRWPSSTKWRAKQRNSAANGIFESFATVIQFLAQPAGRDKNQIWVMECMVAKRMACLIDGPH